ncbi:MAG TPA: hypothetical protein VNZ86_19755 [Bacteroidia bacterium]|jgi:hypothetical protein|nr:hypothetical protein [Bacteroidia bacterium]
MKKKIPFEFVLEELTALSPVVKPMFGCHAVYIGEKIMLVLRDRSDHVSDNGVWVATSKEHHESLKVLFPSLRSIDLLGNGQTNWQVLPAEADDFEEAVNKACDLIRRSDNRIGKVPVPKKKKPRKG